MVNKTVLLLLLSLRQILLVLGTTMRDYYHIRPQKPHTPIRVKELVRGNRSIFWHTLLRLSSNIDVLQPQLYENRSTPVSESYRQVDNPKTDSPLPTISKHQ